MSTPGKPADPQQPAEDTAAADPAPSPAPARRQNRRRPAKPSAPTETGTEPGTAEVVYIGDSEADRLARIQCRIRTKTGRYLRPLTDLGNSERYLDVYGGDLLYVDESDRWRAFNGKHWADTTKDRELHRRVVKVLRDIWSEAGQVKADADATEVRKWAKKSEEKSAIAATKSLLVSECAVSIKDFDPRGTAADTLNLRNGTLNLETFELRPHDKADMISKFSPVEFDPAATAPNWLAHLEWAIPDPETRETVQRYLGYCLTNETREQKMMCWYGPKGRNGKGIIVRAIERILGYDETAEGSDQYAYAHAAPATMLLDGKRGANDASPDMAALVGKRFVSLQETGQGQKFSEVRVKSLTGGDAIAARFLHGNYFVFTPVAKYVLCTNNRPEVAADDPALWRRMMLVNFPNSVSDSAQDADPDYETRIQDELSGILNWLLEGLRKWRESGLQISPAIRADTEAYRREQDWLGSFIEECLEVREAHLVSTAAVYEVYRKWAQDQGQGVHAQRRFRKLLETRCADFFYAKKTGNPSEWYYGGFAFNESVSGANDFERPRARNAANPAERTDPGSPPADHTAYFANLRRAAAAREAAAAARAAEPAAPQRPAAAEPEPGLVALASLSPLCRADLHARCSDEHTGECGCPCHDDPGEALPFDFDPPPPDADEEIPAEDVAAVLAQFGESEHDIDAVIDAAPSGPDPVPAGTEQASERGFTPWRVKPTAYVDLGSGAGITDAGTEFTVRKRSAVASLADVLRAVPAETGYLYLTGADLGPSSELRSWAHTRVPKGWEALHHSSDDSHDTASFRYRRPADEDGKRRQLVIFRAGNWVGRESEHATPGELRAAFALLCKGLTATFGDVVGRYGVPLMGTPGSTGLELIRRTLPRGHSFPILPADLQHMIRSETGQARMEDYAATTHPSGGQHIPDEIPGFYVYDMKFAYASMLGLELPTGPVVIDTVPEFAMRGRGWEPCLYLVRATVPQGWDRAGRLRCRDEAGRWQYPDTPGTTFLTRVWERELRGAQRDGWHIEILERARFTGPKVKPLATFGTHLIALRDTWIPAQDAPEPVRELARGMARQIAVAAIGKLSGTPYEALRSCAYDDMAARPDDGQTAVAPSVDGKRWEWRELTSGRDYLVHPEWSAYIWATCRERLWSHPTQKGVGIGHVPREQLLAARTDGFWTSHPQQIPESGRIGEFRVQLAHAEPLTTPRTHADLNSTREALLEREARA